MSPYKEDNPTYPLISTPILRAVPSTIFLAASISFAFISSILVLAISSNCDSEIFPTLTRGTVLDPFSIFAAFFIK